MDFHPYREGRMTIGDYALIGDCRTAALVSRHGSVDWLCLPHYSSPSVFAALLDPKSGGYFQIRPQKSFASERRYLDNSAVLETVFATDTGKVRLIDLMPLPRGRHRLEPRRELLRLIEGISGEMELRLDFVPRPDYGRGRCRLRDRGALGITCGSGNTLHILSTDLPDLEIAPDGASCSGVFRLRAAERRAISLTFAEHSAAVIPPLGDQAWQTFRDTDQWWKTWSGKCLYSGMHAEFVTRSMITLKLMTHALSGAVIAAPTASLPENPGGTRNWDYRYCWLRDAARTLEAFDVMNYPEEAEDFLGWLLQATRLTHPELQVLYSIYGEARIREGQIPWFSGYAGSRPVRVGNDAWHQLQLDVYGEVVDAAYYFVKRGGQLYAREKNYLIDFGDVVCRRWREPDNGMWEIRGNRRHHTFSKFMCWVVLDRLLKLHEESHLQVRETVYRHEMQAIREAIETHGFNRKLNSYVGAFDSEWPDASLLLMPHHGYIAGSDPRMLGTYAYLRQELGIGRLLYRYPPGSDHIDEPEGAFTACSFWAVDYLAHAGRLEEAESEFTYLVSLANDVGLFSEEFAPDGTLLGNFPQSFSHAGVVTAAIALDRARSGELP